MNTAQTTVIRDAPPWMAKRAMPTALREAADAALLDEGVDEIVAHVAGRADEALGRLVSLISDLAGDAPALARAVAEQRLAIELLARGRRTPSNERLLRALRRGRILGALATIDPWSPVVAVVDGDGTWTLTGRVDISAELPGRSALLVPVRSSDGRRALVWIGIGDAGVTQLPVQSRPFAMRSSRTRRATCWSASLPRKPGSTRR